MIGIKCIHPNCYKEASYNYKNRKKRLYCNAHKLPKMINVVTKRCSHPKCNKLAIINAKYCKNHSNTKIHPNLPYCIFCDKRASFNFIHCKRPEYCAFHKLEDMIDVVSKKCHLCNRRPTYNYKTEKQVLYCKIHKKEGMIDKKNKRCEYHNCNIRALFNFKGEKAPRFCDYHKLKGMTNITRKYIKK